MRTWWQIDLLLHLSAEQVQRNLANDLAIEVTDRYRIAMQDLSAQLDRQEPPRPALARP